MNLSGRVPRAAKFILCSHEVAMPTFRLLVPLVAAAALSAVDSFPGPVVIGTDPGGSDALRVGGGLTSATARAQVITGGVGALVPNETSGVHSYDFISAGGGTQATKSYGNFYLYNSSNVMTHRLASYPSVANFINNSLVLGATNLAGQERLRIVGGTAPGSPGATDVLIGAGQIKAGAGVSCTNLVATGTISAGTTYPFQVLGATISMSRNGPAYLDNSTGSSSQWVCRVDTDYKPVFTASVDGLSVHRTTASTSTTTGALTVAGGMGVGGALNLQYASDSSAISRTATNITRSTVCTQNVTSYDKALYAKLLAYDIPAGVVDSGYKIGVDGSAYAQNANFSGTLNGSYGTWARAGIHTCGPGARVVNAYGLYAEVLSNAGTIDNGYGVYITYPYTAGTVTNRYDLYAATASAKNYFAGYVGIGVTAPTHPLEVNGNAAVIGTLTAKEIRVTSTGADYVFEDGYRLRPLSEVEEFVKRERHLPDMMPARQMQADGLPVSEVVTKQLAKIEELTLYAIDLQKQNGLLRSELSDVRNELADLRAAQAAQAALLAELAKRLAQEKP